MISGIFVAAGGLGIFLIGMVMMTQGLKSLAGDALRQLLARFTTSPTSGALTGAVTTAIIQSSSATTVTAVGFVGAGLLTFPQALGIIFGANVGTTIKGWIVAIFGFKYKLGEFALPLVLVGVLMYLLLNRRWAAVGYALAGFGLIFVGIESLQQGMAGLEGVVTPQSFPSDTIPGRLLLVLMGVGITLVTQSSSAGVATALAAVNANAISFPQAAAMVIGMDVGTTATAALATIGGSTDARRTGYAHVIYNVLTGIGAFLLLTPFTWVCQRYLPGLLDENPEIALVAFHTLFNGLGVILVLPFAGPFARLIMRLVPEQPVPYTQRLDRSLYASPAIAIEAVRATVQELAIVVFGKLSATLSGSEEPDQETALEEANTALKSTRDYIEPVDTSADHGALYPKHLSVIHTIDHLRRLIDRTQEPDRAGRAGKSPTLAELRDKLQLAVQESRRVLSGTSAEPPELKLRELWQEFEAKVDECRQTVVQSAAHGELDIYAAIGRLDTLRWLRRVAYHVWRIVHHLERAKLDVVPEEPDEIPAYLEQPADD